MQVTKQYLASLQMFSFKHLLGFAQRLHINASLQVSKTEKESEKQRIVM